MSGSRPSIPRPVSLKIRRLTFFDSIELTNRVRYLVRESGERDPIKVTTRVEQERTGAEKKYVEKKLEAIEKEKKKGGKKKNRIIEVVNDSLEKRGGPDSEEEWKTRKCNFPTRLLAILGHSKGCNIFFLSNKSDRLTLS